MGNMVSNITFIVHMYIPLWFIAHLVQFLGKRLLLCVCGVQRRVLRSWYQSTVQSIRYRQMVVHVYVFHYLYITVIGTMDVRIISQ